MPQTTNLGNVVKDPDFGTLSRDEQDQVISHFEPTYSSLEENDKNAFITGLGGKLNGSAASAGQPTVAQRIAKTKAGMATQTKLDTPANTFMSPGTVPDKVMGMDTGTLAQGAQNVAGTLKRFVSGGYIKPQQKQLDEIMQGPQAPQVPKVLSTTARGVGALVSDKVTAPSDEDWKQAQEEAGINLAGTLAVGTAEAAPGAISEGLDAAKSGVNAVRSVDPDAVRTRVAENLQARAATNNAKAKAGFHFDPSDLIVPAAVRGVGQLAGAGLGSEALGEGLAEGANVVRRLPAYNRFKARVQEGLASRIAPKTGGTPEFALPEDTTPRDIDSSRTIGSIKTASKDEARRGASWQQGAQESTPGDQPQDERRFATPKPTTPEHIQNELDSSRKEMEYENTPQLETTPAVEPKQPTEFDASTVKSEPKPVDYQKVEQNLTRGKTASAKGGNAALRGGTEEDQAPFAKKLVEVLPELADAKPGTDHDTKLFKGYQDKFQAIKDAQANVPDGTTVPQDPIVDGFENLVNEYKAKGNEAAAANVQRVWDKFADLDEDIPYDQFRDYKRSFFDAKKGSFSTPEMRRAYGVLMEAESQISPELSKANHDYSIVRTATDDLARMHTGTGRRFADVGKAITNPAAKPPVPQEEPPHSRRFNAPL